MRVPPAGRFRNGPEDWPAAGSSSLPLPNGERAGNNRPYPSSEVRAHLRGHDRLLLRLWLSMPNSRALPAGHEVLWRAIEAGALRGGIGQSGVPV